MLLISALFLFGIIFAFSGDFETLVKYREEHGPLKYNVCYAAASGGHIHILDWFFETGDDMRNVIEVACRTGDMAVFSWCLKHNFTPNSRCMVEAAYGNNIPMLESERTSMSTGLLLLSPSDECI